jgi:NADH:ubiquinone oxidoreductase subunit 5 (subunit L)/multisubunit Na+/H+ antiporter MnhA subunit
MFSFPLLCFLLSTLITGSTIGRTLGNRGSIISSLILCCIGMLASILIEYEVVFGGCEAQIDYFGTWISLGSFDITWSSYTDLYSAHMLLTVSLVSFAVHCYAVVYMKNDPHLNLFISYLSAFTFSMLILVVGSNMLIMMLGWEMIGICSYLLIGYWSHRLTASKSAQKAIVVNRISDGLLLWSIIWLWWYTGTLEYDLILLNDSNNISSILGIALLVGCMAKIYLVKMYINFNLIYPFLLVKMYINFNLIYPFLDGERNIHFNC